MAFMRKTLPYVWDYNISEEQFQKMLLGELTFGRLGQDWATVRLLEYASFSEIRNILGFKALVNGWSNWRPSIRSESRKRGFDFLVEWLPQHYPELLS